MTTLFLDLASHEGMLAIVDESSLSCAAPIDHRLSDAELVPLYESLLKEWGHSADHLRRLVCVTGPGGFTSIRNAVTFINALAFGLDVPSAGLHLSDLYRARDASQKAVWLHTTRRTAVFLRAPHDAEPQLIDVEALSSSVSEYPSWMGELLPEHEARISSLPAAELRPLQEMLPGLLSTLDFRKQTILPWYGRGI